MQCPICKSVDLKNVYQELDKCVASDLRFISEKIRNMICVNCGNVFNKLGARNKVVNFYKNDYSFMDNSYEAEFKYFSEKSSSTLSKLRLQALLENLHLPKTGKILDIGCGKGNFLKEFSQHFDRWELCGVEISKNALKYAKESLNNAILHEGFFSTDIFDDKFDLIVSLGVIEHLEEPYQFLQDVRQNLKNNGYIFMETPNFKLYPADLLTYDHLSHFTIETISNLLGASGFNIMGHTENKNRIPLFLIGEISNEKSNILNHYNLTNRLVQDHLTFVEEMFDVYEYCSQNSKGKIGIFGLGIIGWAGIMFSKLDTSKVVGFFDENELLTGTKMNGFEIHHISELKNFVPTDMVIAANPCYFEQMINKLRAFKVNIHIPKNFNYYAKYFN